MRRDPVRVAPAAAWEGDGRLFGGHPVPVRLLSSPTRGPAGGFVEALGRVQRSVPPRPAARLFEVAPREASRREIGLARQRLEDAARALTGTAPKAVFTTERQRESVDSRTVTTTQEVETQTEETTPATPSRQVSTAFASADQIIAGNKSRLELDFGPGSNLKVQVGATGASLDDLAALVNDAPENQGRATAQVISTPEGFRLEITSTATGSAATLDVARDAFKSFPVGPDFALIDPALAEAGQDESVEIVTTTETVENTFRRANTREIETRQQVDDETFAAVVEEYVAAFEALRGLVSAQRGLPGRAPGPLAEDAELARLAGALEELSGGLEARQSESGLTLEDIGLALDDRGSLVLDSEILQAAIAGATTSVVQLLVSSEGGLGADALAALEPPEDDASEVRRALGSSLRGFQARLGAAEIRLAEREAILDALATSLERTPATSLS